MNLTSPGGEILIAYTFGSQHAAYSVATELAIKSGSSAGGLEEMHNAAWDLELFLPKFGGPDFRFRVTHNRGADVCGVYPYTADVKVLTWISCPNGVMLDLLTIAVLQHATSLLHTDDPTMLTDKVRFSRNRGVWEDTEPDLMIATLS